MSRGAAAALATAALTCALLGPSRVGAQGFAAGYEQLRITDAQRNRPIHLDIWYPASPGLERAHDYGISAGSVAVDAELAGDDRPVVLLSHGAMGAAANYSWIAEHLARRGLVVLGVSHFAESPVFGADSMRPESAARFRDRTQDLSAALDFLVTRSGHAARLDAARLAAIGHSSGGASVLMSAGGEFSRAALGAYCASAESADDKGCAYPSAGDSRDAEPRPLPAPYRLRALVLLDPAVGPGFADAALARLSIPVLVIGSVENDFLPYASHAGRIAERLPGAQAIRLERGEGHFVYLDVCAAPIEAMGVPICSDRPGVDRVSVHRTLALAIEAFLTARLAPPTR